MTRARLREWHGVKLVAAPSGVAITTRLRTTPADDHVLDLVAGHLGRLRRADLAAVSRQAPVNRGLDAEGRHRARKDRLNSRKTALTAQSSSRWASAIIRGNDEQCRLASRNQERHAALRPRSRPSRPASPSPQRTPSPSLSAPHGARPRRPRATPPRLERFQKQRRLQHLKAELRRGLPHRLLGNPPHASPPARQPPRARPALPGQSSASTSTTGTWPPASWMTAATRPAPRCGSTSPSAAPQAAGGSHRDRASRPRPQGPAPGKCDTHTTRGSRRESY